jgi:hypothetical protein
MKTADNATVLPSIASKIPSAATPNGICHAGLLGIQEAQSHRLVQAALPELGNFGIAQTGDERRADAVAKLIHRGTAFCKKAHENPVRTQMLFAGIVNNRQKAVSLAFDIGYGVADSAQ